MRKFTPAFLILMLLTAALSARAADNLPVTDKVEDLTKFAKPAGAKIVLLNVWGQTCARCLLEMPFIVKAVTALKDNPDVAFVGLCSPDDDVFKNKAIIPACSAIAQKKQLNYPNYIWSGEAEPLIKKFKMEATPFNCIMSADGKVLAELDIPEDKEKAYDYIIEAIKKALADVGKDKK